MEPLRCPKCQADLSQTDLHCPFCGSDRAKGNAFCPECRADLVSAKRQCPFCGYDLLSAPPGKRSPGNALLTLGQVLSLLACVAIVVALAKARAPGLLEFFGGVAAILYNLAMFVVFGRVKRII
jgi:hypothetical protein